jgi:predicted nucleic acid-binding protein
MAFVLDASVALTWCFADEASAFSASLLRRLAAGEEAIVPAHWPLEVLSALIQGKRRKRIDDLGIEQFIRDIASFHITVEQNSAIADMGDLKKLSDEHTLTAYDAAYLELARKNAVPLATLDAALVRACVKAQTAVLTAAAS